MTKKEIIDGLKFTVAMFLLDPSTGETITEPRNDMDKTTIDACKGAIELLEQEPQTGHWIPLGNYDDYGNENTYKCSECGDIEAYPDNYCSNCGAKMFEEQEEGDHTV